MLAEPLYRSRYSGRIVPSLSERELQDSPAVGVEQGQRPVAGGELPQMREDVHALGDRDRGPFHDDRATTGAQLPGLFDDRRPVSGLRELSDGVEFSKAWHRPVPSRRRVRCWWPSDGVVAPAISPSSC
jgi:hypothetical protein